MSSNAAAPFPDTQTLLARLRAREPELRADGVAALYLFGSAAHGAIHAASDIDLFLDQAEPDRFDLFDLMSLRDRIAAALGGLPVDLTTRGGLHPVLRPTIEAEAVRVF